MATTKAKKARKPVDLAEAFGKALDEAVQIDERYHLEDLLAEARRLLAALELALTDKQPGCEQEDWRWCLTQLDEVNASLISRNNTLRNLRLSPPAKPNHYDFPDIPF